MFTAAVPSRCEDCRRRLMVLCTSERQRPTGQDLLARAA
jgi:ribosomal protein L36